MSPDRDLDPTHFLPGCGETGQQLAIAGNLASPQAATGAAAIVERIEKAVLGHGEPDDDISAVVVKRTG